MSSVDFRPTSQESADNIQFLIHEVADAIMGKKLDLYLYAFAGKDAQAANEDIRYADVFLQHLKSKRTEYLLSLNALG
jgi:hypothetical protein